ncbi:ATP-grasp domain-containing protein (plasmid) [Pantoea vagans]|uniref:ATP-grasp domain-containing protein n=1 Tax=Pantoea vagans TaxID=470934 RepID=UPI003513FBBC
MESVIITSHFNNDLSSDACDELGFKKSLTFYMPKIKELSIDFKYEYYDNIKSYAIRLKELANEIDFIWSTSGSEINSLAELKAVKLAKITDIYLGMNESAVYTAGYKSLTQELMASLGISVPKGVQCKSKKEIQDFFEHHGGTIICKANNGAGGVNQFYCKNSDDVVELPSEMNDWYVESFLKGLEFSVNVYILNGSYIASPIMFKGETDIYSVHAMDKFRYISRLKHQVLLEKINIILNKISNANIFNGWIEVEFIKTQQELVVIEINARYNGTIRATGYACKENLYQLDLESKVYNKSLPQLNNKNEVIEIPIHLDINTGLKSFGFVQKMKSRKTNSGRVTIWGEDKSELIEKIKNTECDIYSDKIIQGINESKELFSKYI